MTELSYDQYNSNGDLTALASVIDAAFTSIRTRLDGLDGGDNSALLQPGSVSLAMNFADGFGRNLETYLNNPNKNMLGDWTIKGSLTVDGVFRTDVSGLRIEIDSSTGRNQIHWYTGDGDEVTEATISGELAGGEGHLAIRGYDMGGGNTRPYINLKTPDTSSESIIEFVADILDFANQDVRITHIGNSAVTFTNSGGWSFHYSNGEAAINFNENGSVQLRYNDALKISTTNTGVDIFGGIVTDTDTSDLVPGAERTNAFANSWGNFNAAGGSYDQQAYRANKNGEVVLTGLVDSSGSEAAGSTIFTLDAGYRPAKRLMFNVITDTGAERVDVHTNGIVQWQGTTSTHGFVSLNGIRFYRSGV